MVIGFLEKKLATPESTDQGTATSPGFSVLDKTQRFIPISKSVADIVKKFFSDPIKTLDRIGNVALLLIILEKIFKLFCKLSFNIIIFI